MNGAAPGDGQNDEMLTGGNVTPVRRRGDAVLRAAGPWTSSVHSVLAHARLRGVHGVPEPWGLDAAGEEVLEYLPGTVPTYPMPAWVWDEAILEQSARWLRAWHDATADCDPPGAVWRVVAHEPAEVICHNDFAPYNLVFDAASTPPRLTGVIDFDTMSPGPRLWDIAYLAYRLVPYLDDSGPEQPRPAERGRRLRMLLAAYGSDHSAADVLACMADRLDELAAFTDENAAVTGRQDLREHSALYRADAARLRSTDGG